MVVALCRKSFKDGIIQIGIYVVVIMVKDSPWEVVLGPIPNGVNRVRSSEVPYFHEIDVQCSLVLSSAPDGTNK